MSGRSRNPNAGHPSIPTYCQREKLVNGPVPYDMDSLSRAYTIALGRCLSLVVKGSRRRIELNRLLNCQFLQDVQARMHLGP